MQNENTPTEGNHSVNQETEAALDDATCSSSVLTDGGLISRSRKTEPQPMQPVEGYPAGWIHCKIHLNPATGEMHSDGDHRVRHWIQRHLDAIKLIESIIIETNGKRIRATD